MEIVKNPLRFFALSPANNVPIEADEIFIRIFILLGGEGPVRNLAEGLLDPAGLMFDKHNES
jgi:hypothetical protein